MFIVRYKLHDNTLHLMLPEESTPQLYICSHGILYVFFL